MAQKDPHNPEIVSGFNQGYLMAKELPKLKIEDFYKMPKEKQESPRMQGFLAGLKQYRNDQYIAKIKSRAQPPKGIKPDKGMSRS